jgi:hypothetical protein
MLSKAMINVNIIIKFPLCIPIGFNIWFDLSIIHSNHFFHKGEVINNIY